jgi:hypothetical protein
MKRFIQFITLSSLSLGMSHCGSEHKTNVNDLPKVDITFKNQSQFIVEALYIHDKVDNYAGQENRLTDFLSPGDSRTFQIPKTPWYVTVYRRPNKDASVLAYTTSKEWDPAKYSKLIYFDEQFRSQ